MTEKRTISLPSTLYQKAMIQVEARSFGSFSDYIQHLIREDHERRGAHLRSADPQQVAEVAAVMKRISSGDYPDAGPPSRLNEPNSAQDVAGEADGADRD